MTTRTYPLYCVDRQDKVDPESQYHGPFNTHDDAAFQAVGSDLIRRCRQLLPSEIAFDRDAASLAVFDTFDALVDDIDEAACSGNLPVGAWLRFDKRVVITKYDPGTLPDHRNFDTWADDCLSLDAWICEGDE